MGSRIWLPPATICTGASLSGAERDRAARYVRAEDGDRWAHVRGILRALLARYADAEPSALRFAEGAHGKLQLVWEASQGNRRANDASPTDRLRFNLSHSGEALLVAGALDREVGVDVELPRRSTRPRRDRPSHPRRR